MKRILWKRNDGAALRDQATARLAASVRSIINDPAVEDKNTMLGKSFVQYLDYLNSLTGTRTSLNDAALLHKIFKNDSERSEPDLSNTNAGMPNRRRRRAGDDDETETERRSREADEKDKDMTEKSHSLDNIVKRFGFVALAKSINAGSIALTEAEYTQALVSDCARRGVSFEKVFCDTSSEGVEIRKGRERCRDTAFAKAGAGALMPIAPTFVGGAEARNVDAGEEGDAYQALVAMAEKMRAASPGMKLDEAFSRTYVSPEARELAELERRQSRNRLPVTGGFASGTLAPLQMDKAERDVTSDEDGGEAYQKLARLAEEMSTTTGETFAKCFEKVYLAPANRETAEAERRANRPIHGSFAVR
jgi:hypothetical protein